MKSPKLTAAEHAAARPFQFPLYLIALAGLAVGYVAITRLVVGIGDEDVHRFQIDWFVQGRYEIFQYVTMLPLYHWVVAMGAKFSGLTSLNGIRFIHLVFAATAIPAYFALCKALYPAGAAARTLQFMFIPILFPLFFVTYTDLPALAFTLLMLERTFRRKYVWAALFALVAVAMRQPNIVWAGFAGGLIALQTAREMAVRLQLRSRDGGRGLLEPDYLQAIMARAKYLLLVFVISGAFVIWNGGVAVGDAGQHAVSLNLSNLYFCLMVAFVLFLPFNIAQVGSIGRLLRGHWWALPALAACFALYFATYEHPHKYNTAGLAFYRHNMFIHYTSDITAVRIAAFIPMAWMVLAYVTAARASDYRGEMLLLVPFALLSFVPMPLIEPRYYLAAFSLFLAFRPAESRACSAVTLVFYMGASAYILSNISRQVFFL